MRIIPFDDGVSAHWDLFLLEQSGSSFFHQIGWKRALEKTFGYRPLYFFTERQGQITGVAPVFEISNWIMGRCLISVPFGVYGGICARDKDSERALLDHLIQLGAAERVDYLELRNRNGGLLPGFHSNPRYATFTMPLVASPENIYQSLPKDVRYMIRKAEKAGLLSRRGLDQLESFYRLFAVSMRRLGTPVLPRLWFENLVREFPRQVDLLLVYANGRPVAGAMSFLFRGTMQPYYVGATGDAGSLAANDFMWWELIKYAAQSGMRCFDFGRSKQNTGSYAFKKKWKPKIEPLDYQVYLVGRTSVPNFTPQNPRFELATRVWKSTPLRLTRLIGPRVVRWFP